MKNEIKIVLKHIPDADDLINAIDYAEAVGVTLGGVGKEFFLSGLTPGDEDAGFHVATIIALLTGTILVLEA